MSSVPNLYTGIDSKFSPSKFSKMSGRSTSSSNGFDNVDNTAIEESLSRGLFRGSNRNISNNNDNNQAHSTTNTLLKETETSKARRKSANAALTKRGHSSSSSFTTLPNIGHEKDSRQNTNRKFENTSSRGRSTTSSSSSASAYDKVDDNAFHAALQELNQIKQEYRGSGSIGVKSSARGDSSESKRANSPATSAISLSYPPYPTSSALTRRSNSSRSRDSDSPNYSPSADRFHQSFAAKDFENNVNGSEELSNEINALREERDRATSKLKVAEKVMRQLYHKSKELQEAADSSARPLSSGNKIKDAEDNSSKNNTPSKDLSKTPNRVTKSNDDIYSNDDDELKK